MATLRPQIQATLSEMTGVDVYGTETWGTGRTVAIAVVNLAVGQAPSPVRADSSASRSRLDEPTEAGQVLFLPGDRPNMHDRLDIQGYGAFRIVGIQPRHNLMGRVAFWLVTLGALV